MAVTDRAEAARVDEALGGVLDAPDLDAATARLRALWVDRLDFEPDRGTIPLRGDALPPSATRIAHREGVRVVAAAFAEPGRVRRAAVREALKQLREALGDDVLLAATNLDGSEWHLAYPAHREGRETVRRMVAYRGQPRRTVSTQLGKLWRELEAGRDLRAALERAYDVEAVTKEFFREYDRCFRTVSGLIEGLPDEAERRLYCQTLFNRLMFLAFLEKKGWLRFRGETEYLQALWKDWRETGARAHAADRALRADGGGRVREPGEPGGVYGDPEGRYGDLPLRAHGPSEAGAAGEEPHAHPTPQGRPPGAPVGAGLRARPPGPHARPGDAAHAGASTQARPAGNGRPSGFYAERLTLLFFTALNNPRDANWDQARRVIEPLIGETPFLNGGLFEQGELDARLGVRVPDAAIGAILDELFARFNFTIMESTPYDQEVAVDPEMLGRVFEELVTGRHDTGAYYTPRPIVSYMCREALKHHLADRVPGLSPDAVARFVDAHEVAQLSLQQARGVLEALDALTVLDPACGSGAYLLGMLHELIDLQRLLYSSELIADSRSLYELKLRVIERNVYGADIERFAVNIAMLRLWLSLAIEYDGPVDSVPALPNLGFKIALGDSLLAPSPAPAADQTPNMFAYRAHEKARELASLKAEHMRETGERKRELERTIAEETAELTKLLEHTPAPAGSVDWRVAFAEVFDRGGFDVVLANPPYVRMEMFKGIKPTLRRVYPEAHSDRADLYIYYFYARALQLLRDRGLLVFISCNKWFRAGYGAGLRRHVAATTAVLGITDFGDLPVFESATAYPMIFLARKGGAAGAPTIHTLVPSLDPPYPDVRAVVERYGRALPPDALDGEGWGLADDAAAGRQRTMRAAGVPLGEYVGGRIYRGVVTGYNKAFVIDGSTRAALLAADPVSGEVIKPFVIGRDVRKWAVGNADRWLLYMFHGVPSERHGAVLDYLGRYRERLEKRATKQEWYELQQPQFRYSAAFDQPKIVFPDIAKTPRFALDTSGGYADTTIFFIPTDDLYLLGLLNSRAVLDFYVQVSAEIRGGFLRYKRQYVTQIPIPSPSPTDRTAIADLAARCMEARGVGPEVADWEAEIDARVARLYGLEAGVSGVAVGGVAEQALPADG